jgi:CHAT domain-containing protein
MNLTHTGLLLANANNTLLNTNREESDNMDDGILFASELATIELKNTDLLVLSACETALGDLSFSEGVFGLQRGYKLAGGKSIIMSLWEVDDTATMLFMSSLYNNLKTMQLNEAFYSARMDLRMLDDGKWDNPKFYNAFILLDSL